MSHELLLNSPEEAIKLLGKNGELRKRIQEAAQVRIVDRGAKVAIIGEEHDARLIGALLRDMLEAVRAGHTPSLADLDYALAEAREKNGAASAKMLSERPAAIRADIQIRPRTRGQKTYLDAIHAHELTLVIGPAGTGKTYLAMAAAVSSLLSKQVQRLVLTRPAVEAGESLGFLPGDLVQKVNPYLRPLYDALYAMVDMEQVRRWIDQERIEVAPLAFMRGRTLDNAFVILDEAQNTTPEQMLMFLTRLGQGSRAVVTGDVTQVDLPPTKQSGLIHAKRVLEDVDGIGIVYLHQKDVVRNALVQRVIGAYDADRNGVPPGGDTAGRSAADAQ